MVPTHLKRPACQPFKRVSSDNTSFMFCHTKPAYTELFKGRKCRSKSAPFVRLACFGRAQIWGIAGVRILLAFRNRGYTVGQNNVSALRPARNLSWVMKLLFIVRTCGSMLGLSGFLVHPTGSPSLYLGWASIENLVVGTSNPALHTAWWYPSFKCHTP